MTFLAFLTTLLAGLLIGFCAGAWAATGFKVPKAKTDPSEFSFWWEREP